METLVKDFFTPIIDWKFLEFLHNSIQEYLDIGYNIRYCAFFPKYNNYNHRSLFYAPMDIEDSYYVDGWPKDYAFNTYKRGYKENKKKFCYGLDIIDKENLRSDGGDVKIIMSHIATLNDIADRIKKVYNVKTDDPTPFANGSGAICINFITKPIRK